MRTDAVGFLIGNTTAVILENIECTVLVYEKDLMRAAEEGMQNDDRAHILKEVKKALISLQESSPGR